MQSCYIPETNFLTPYLIFILYFVNFNISILYLSYCFCLLLISPYPIWSLLFHLFSLSSIQILVVLFSDVVFMLLTFLLFFLYIFSFTGHYIPSVCFYPSLLPFSLPDILNFMISFLWSSFRTWQASLRAIFRPIKRIKNITSK